MLVNGGPGGQRGVAIMVKSHTAGPQIEADPDSKVRGAIMGPQGADRT